VTEAKNRIKKSLEKGEEGKTGRALIVGRTSGNVSRVQSGKPHPRSHRER